MADDFGLDLHGVTQEHHTKKRIIEAVAIWLQRKALAIPVGCAQTLRQVKAYEYKQSPRTKLYTYSGPVGTHDDLVSCLAMYVEALVRDWIMSSTGRRNFGVGAV